MCAHNTAQNNVLPVSSLRHCRGSDRITHRKTQHSQYEITSHNFCCAIDFEILRAHFHWKSHFHCLLHTNDNVEGNCACHLVRRSVCFRYFSCCCHCCVVDERERSEIKCIARANIFQWKFLFRFSSHFHSSFALFSFARFFVPNPTDDWMTEIKWNEKRKRWESSKRVNLMFRLLLSLTLLCRWR